jgi:hypothetical protein
VSQLSQVTTPLDTDDPFPRTIRPRSDKPRKRYAVVAVNGFLTGALTEDGRELTFDELVAYLPEMGPTLFVTLNQAAEFVLKLHERYSANATWNAGIVPGDERAFTGPGEFRVPLRTTYPVRFFGWRSTHKGTPNRMHHAIDPLTYHARHLHEMCPPVGGETPIRTLLRWGVALRDFCQAHNWEVRPTQGATVSQALTDSRFYPGARRKVPKCINARAREHLPGNHWKLLVKPEKVYPNAIYLDQSRCHHYHAEHVGLPDANELWAYGRFWDLARIMWENVPSQFYGLYCLDLAHSGSYHCFDWIRGDLTKQFIWSSELPHVLDMGYRVTGVRAMWGSPVRDQGIPAYARWAQDQLDTYPGQPWLKPLLVSLYGVLACTPKQPVSWYAQAKKGDVAEIFVGARHATGYRAKGKQKIEPRIANVLHRGLIEAATRSETVGMAQHLNRRAISVYHLYVDGIIVEDEESRPVPELPAPWRCDKYLQDYCGQDDISFTSRQMSKQPGRSLHRGKPVNVSSPRREMNARTTARKARRASYRPPASGPEHQ